MPQILGNVAYTGYSGEEPNVRKAAGTFGARDWTNRYTICAGAGNAGSSGSGDTIGHHMIKAETTSATCAPKWNASERTDSVTTAGQWVNSRTALNRINAGKGRSSRRATAA